MKSYYFENEHGTYFSMSKTRRFIKMTAKEAYDFLKEEAGRGIQHRFMKVEIELPVSDDERTNPEYRAEPIIEKVFIEVRPEQVKRVRKDERREQYIAQCEEKSGLETVSLNASLQDHDDLTIEETVALPEESVEDLAFRNMRLESLRRALQQLSAEEYEIIYALYLSKEPISESQLSKRLGVPRTTLQSQKYQIFEKLKNFF